jgi:hypothetical protein
MQANTTYEEVERWASSGIWVDSSVIDILMLNTLNVVPHTEYIPTTSGIYMNTLRRIIGDPTSRVIEDAYTKVAAKGRIEAYDPKLKGDTQTLVFPLNLSGTHWVFAHVSSSTQSPRTIRIYDSLRNKCAVTLSQLHYIIQSIQLIGRYNPSFAFDWNGTIAYGRTVTQILPDCGPIVVWGMRTVLTGRIVDFDCDNPIKFRDNIRLSGIREIYHIFVKSTREELLRVQRDMIQLHKSTDPAQHTNVTLKGRDYFSAYFRAVTLDGAISAVISSIRTHGIPPTPQMVEWLLLARWEGIGFPKSDVNLLRFTIDYFNFDLDRETNPHALTTGLFFYNHHLSSPADDLHDTFHLVLAVVRQSNNRSVSALLRSEFEFQDQKANYDTIAHQLYRQWSSVFDRVRTRFKFGPTGNVTYPYHWDTYLMGVRSSNSSLGNPRLADSHMPEDKRIDKLLRSCADAHTRPRVLFLQAGADGITTQNDTWRSFIEQYPTIDLNLTTVARSTHTIVQAHPEVWTVRHKYGFAHHSFRRLSLVLELRIAASHSLDPSHAIFVSWLDSFAEKNTTSRIRERGLGIEMQRTRVVHEIPNKLCKECGRTVPGSVWIRGNSTACSVRCSEH